MEWAGEEWLAWSAVIAFAGLCWRQFITMRGAARFLYSHDRESLLDVRRDGRNLTHRAVQLVLIKSFHSPSPIHTEFISSRCGPMMCRFFSLS